MTTWFLFLFSELFIAWCILFIGSSIVDDPQSLLAHAAGFKSKKLKEHPELYEKVQTDYGKDLKKVGLISAVISLVGMLFVISLPQENMIQFANCILLVEIVVFVLNYVRHQNSLKKTLAEGAPADPATLARKWDEAVLEENTVADEKSVQTTSDEIETEPVVQEAEVTIETETVSVSKDEPSPSEQDIPYEEDVPPIEEMDLEVEKQNEPESSTDNLPPVLGDLVDSIYTLGEQIDREVQNPDDSDSSDSDQDQKNA